MVCNSRQRCSEVLIVVGLLSAGFAGCLQDSAEPETPAVDPLVAAYGLQTVPAPDAPALDQWLLVTTNATTSGTLATFETTIPKEACSNDFGPYCAYEVLPLPPPGRDADVVAWGLYDFRDDLTPEPGAIAFMGIGSIEQLYVDPQAPEDVLLRQPPMLQAGSSPLFATQPGEVRLTSVARSETPMPMGVLFRFVEPDFQSAQTATRDEILADVTSPVGLAAPDHVGQGYRFGIYGNMGSHPEAPGSYLRTRDVSITRSEETSPQGGTVSFQLDATMPSDQGWGSASFGFHGGGLGATVTWSATGSLHGTAPPAGGQHHPLAGFVDPERRAAPAFEIHHAGVGGTELHVEVTAEALQPSGQVQWVHLDVGVSPAVLL